MPRPRLHSDEVILDATRAVLKRRGPSAFTLNDVAIEVGISRAALIQRFQNRDTLLQYALERAVDVTRQFLEEQPVEVGPQALWRFLQKLCEVFGPGDSYEVHVLIAWYEARDPALRALAQERNSLVEAAICARLPQDLRPAPPMVASLLQAIIGGATMQWITHREDRLDAYILERLRQLLLLLFPDERFRLPKFASRI